MKSFTQHLNESMTSALPFTEITKYGGYRFTDPTGKHAIEVSFCPTYKGGSSYELVFNMDGNFSRQNRPKLDSNMRVLSTIVNIARKFINEKRPKRLNFFAFDDDPKVDWMYGKFAQQIAKEFGGVAGRNGKSHTISFSYD